MRLIFSKIRELLPHGLNQFCIRLPIQFRACYSAVERFFSAGTQNKIMYFIALKGGFAPGLQKPWANNSVYNDVISAVSITLCRRQKSRQHNPVLIV